MKKIFKWIINNGIELLFGLLIVYYLFSCTFYTFQDPRYKCLLMIPFMLLIYFVVFKLLEKIQLKNERLLKIVIVTGSLFVYLAWEGIYGTIPVSDYKELWNHAIYVANGSFSDYTFDITHYFYWWNHQIGYEMFLGGIVKIFGHRLAIMKVIEFLMLSFSNLFLYNIAKRITSKKAALITTIVYSTFLFNIGGAGIINNQHAAIFFVLAGLNIFVMKDHAFNKTICAILFAIAYILRPNALIFFIALICYYIYLFLKNCNLKVFKNMCISILLVVIPFVLFAKGFDYILIKTKTIPNSFLTAHCPYFKFILGTQWQNMHGPGTWHDLVYYDFDYEQYNIDAKNYVTNKYKTQFKSNILPFWIEKMVRFSAYPDSQIDFTGHKESEVLVSYMKYYGYIQYVLVLLSVLGTMIIIYQKQKQVKHFVFLKIAFIGFFLVHIFIEVQPRYRFDQYFILAVLAAPCLLFIFDKIDIAFKKCHSNIKKWSNTFEFRD